MWVWRHACGAPHRKHLGMPCNEGGDDDEGDFLVAILEVVVEVAFAVAVLVVVDSRASLLSSTAGTGTTNGGGSS